MKTNIKKILLPIIGLVVSFNLMADMTDSEALDYARTAAAQGKSQQQIAKELAMRGVTQAQLQRVRAQMENTAAPKAGNRGNVTTGNNIMRQNGNATAMEENVLSLQQGAVLDTLTIMRPVVQGSAEDVYGRNIFQSGLLTFEPNENIATPDDYKLGPGDEVVINVWGNNEDNVRAFISPEGTIMVSQIGPVHLSGMTIKEANRYLKNVFAQKYADISEEGSDISVTLGNLRTIQVDIMGEVTLPGTYRLSPFSTLFNALYRAGGTTPTGTLREIEIYRNGKKIGSSDLYEYLFNGKTSGDIRLMEGDVIMVSPYDRLVTIQNGVKRPMTYEMKKGETIADVLEYAGGLSGDAFGEQLTLIRTTGNGMNVMTVNAEDFASTRLDDGDLISFNSALDRFNNRIEIRGSVFRPGIYELGDEVLTVKDLINKSQGLTEDAFIDRVQLFREAPDLSQSYMALDLAGILNGTVPDIPLQNNDVIIIPSVLELQPKGDVIISGAVSLPGRYNFAEGMTVEDLVLRAGGLREGASQVNIEISRRIIDKNATSIESEIAETYTVNLSDGLTISDEDNIILQPNDIVDVRFSPIFMPQKRVSISGEVPFVGQYTLSKRTERLSDLVARAGGVSPYAYLKGAHLTRRYSDDEKAAKQEALRLAMQEGSDSIDASMLFVADTYPVGIDLEKALANPGGYEDLVLQEGDQLFIPEMVNTVKITGDVLYPNSVVYTPGKKLGYYIDQAGGYGNNANKRQAFVVYLNGQVAKGKGANIEPGCQIIVPTKEKKDGAANLQKWLTIGSSAASLGTMAASIVNLLKK